MVPFQGETLEIKTAFLKVESIVGGEGEEYCGWGSVGSGEGEGVFWVGKGGRSIVGGVEGGGVFGVRREGVLIFVFFRF